MKSSNENSYWCCFIVRLKSSDIFDVHPLVCTVHSSYYSLSEFLQLVHVSRVKCMKIARFQEKNARMKFGKQIEFQLVLQVEKVAIPDSNINGSY